MHLLSGASSWHAIDRQGLHLWLPAHEDVEGGICILPFCLLHLVHVELILGSVQSYSDGPLGALWRSDFIGLSPTTEVVHQLAFLVLHL